MIDALDEAACVTITGREGNETSMRVMLHKLGDGPGRPILKTAWRM